MAQLETVQARIERLRERLPETEREEAAQAAELSKLLLQETRLKQQLAQVQRDKAGLEQEMLTARQMTARGTNYEPKFIEIHHNHLSDDDSDEDSDDDDDDGKG